MEPISLRALTVLLQYELTQWDYRFKYVSPTASLSGYITLLIQSEIHTSWGQLWERAPWTQSISIQMWKSALWGIRLPVLKLKITTNIAHYIVEEPDGRIQGQVIHRLVQ